MNNTKIPYFYKLHLDALKQES